MSEGALKMGGEGFEGLSAPDHDSAAAPVDGARPGVTSPTQPGGWTGFIDDVIVELGYADQGTVEWAVEQGRVLGQTVSAVLLDSRIVDEDQLSRAIAELHGLDHVDLDAFDVDLDVARLISRQAGRRYKAVPIAFDSDGTLIVALADPVDPLAVSDIAVMTRSEVRPMVATQYQIEAIVEQPEDAPGIPGVQDDVAAGPVVMDNQAVPERDYGSMVEPSPAIVEPSPLPSEPTPAGPAPAPAAAQPEPEPEAASEMPEELARMRSAVADLAARLESFTPPDDDIEADRDAMREQVESSAGERERLIEERDLLREELEAAERRALAAQASLAELRTARDRERAEQAKVEEELRAKLEAAKEANQRLEERLASVLAATAEVRTACEKLAAGPTD